jgi:hypothetical protein
MLALIIICVLLSVPALAQEPDKEATALLEEFHKIIENRYSDFKKIERFGGIFITCSGSAEKIGLSKKGLIDYVKLRYKNNFGNITFKEPTPEEISIYFDKARGEKIGQMEFIIWTVGDDYPIAFHIRCTAGNYDRFDIWKSEVLGYGSKNNVPDLVKKTIDGMMEELAVGFFKARGEM